MTTGWVTEHRPTDEGLSACVQCGLCLPVCPTFRLTGRETASPRGRIQAMRAVAGGHATVDAKFEEIIDFCLGCRACEPVCPGMVPYGRLLEGSRAEIREQHPTLTRRLRGWILGRVVPSPSFMGLITGFLRVLQRLRLVRLIPRRFRRSVIGLRPLEESTRVPDGVGPTGGIGLLTGCIQQQWFPEVNKAAIELLTYAGYEVSIPPGQTCCGALAAHDGHAEVADGLGEVNDRAFRSCERVVTTVAGCSAHLVDRDPQRAVDITGLVSEAIEQGRLPMLPKTGVQVVAQDPCHLRHAQRSIRPQRLILEAAGLDVLDIDDDGMCCGAAGLYAVLHPEASAQLGRQKADRIKDLGGGLVASANPGCEMQLRAFLGEGFRISHPIELYFDALRHHG